MKFSVRSLIQFDSKLSGEIMSNFDGSKYKAGTLDPLVLGIMEDYE